MLPKRATSPANEIMETDSAGATVRRYLRLPGSVDETFLMIDYSAGGVAMETWAHTNRLGSTVATSDTLGVVLDTYTYDDYGNAGAEGTGGFPFRFTGQKLDPETGLMYYKARYYSTDLGRFLQVDPIGYEDQMNMYAYVANDPLNATDPTGKVTCLENCIDVQSGIFEGQTPEESVSRVRAQDAVGSVASVLLVAEGAALTVGLLDGPQPGPIDATAQGTVVNLSKELLGTASEIAIDVAVTGIPISPPKELELSDLTLDGQTLQDPLDGATTGTLQPDPLEKANPDTYKNTGSPVKPHAYGPFSDRVCGTGGRMLRA